MFINTRNKTKRLKHAFIAQSIALALACSTSVLAAPQSIDIKGQSLAEALKILGQQTGLQIIYNADLITGKYSPAVQGSYESTEVLQQLLNGSNVTFNLSENTVTLISINDISSKNMGTLALTKIGDISSKDGSAEAGYRVENISGIGIYKERSLQETPYAITVLSDSLIENVIAGDTDQLFKMTPTVQAAGLKSNYGSQPIVIRGSYSSSPAIDGMSVVGRYGSSTEDVERVEVLTGLSGFLYGASAIDSVGGKINYVYKRPTKERLTKLTLGNYGGEQYFIHADLGGPIGDDGQLGYRLNLVKQDGDTMVDDQHINKLLISGAFDWHITDDLLMQLHLSHRDYKLDGRSSFISPDLDNMDNILDTSSPIIETSTALTPSWASFENKTNQAKFDITWDISDVVTLRSSYYTKKTEIPYDIWSTMLIPPAGITLPFPPFTTLQPDGFLQSFKRYTGSEVEDKGGRLLLDFEFNTRNIQHQMTLGYTQNKFSEQTIGTKTRSPLLFINVTNLSGVNSTSEPDWSTGDEDVSTLSTTTYSNIMIGDDITFNKKWSALLGVNKASIKSTGEDSSYDKSAITPSVAIMYKPVPAITTYINYMEALTQGTIVENEYTNAGEVMEPIISEQIEIGAKYEFDDVLLTAALFKIKKANTYVETDFNTLEATFTQDGLAVHQGLEVTITGKITDNFTLMGGFTLMDLSIEKADANEGNSPGYTADKTAKLYAEYILPSIEGLTLTGGIYYTGEKFYSSDNLYQTDAYTLADLGARYSSQISDTPVTFRLMLNNITDENYWVSPYYLGTPRAISFSVSLNF